MARPGFIWVEQPQFPGEWKHLLNPEPMPLNSVHVLFLIRLDAFFVDKITDLAQAGIISADLGHDFREYVHQQAFLVILVECENRGSQFFECHGFSPLRLVMRRLAVG